MPPPRPVLPGLVAPSACAHNVDINKRAQLSFLLARFKCGGSSGSTHLELFHKSLETWAARRGIDLCLVLLFLLKIQCPECGKLVVWLVQLGLPRPTA